VRITTADSLDYRFIPITKNSISVGIKASHDARIALRTHLGSDSNVYEVFCLLIYVIHLYNATFIYILYYKSYINFVLFCFRLLSEDGEILCQL